MLLKRWISGLVCLCVILTVCATSALGEEYHQYKSDWEKRAFIFSYNKNNGIMPDTKSDVETMNVVREIGYLDLSGMGLTELPDLSDFTSLKALNISNNPISDISALDNNQQLLQLDISNTQIEMLPSLPSLELLFAITPTLKDISTLGTKLVQIKIASTSVTDFSPLDRQNQDFEYIVLGNKDRELTSQEISLIQRNTGSLKILELMSSSFDLPFLNECYSLFTMRFYGDNSVISDDTLQAIKQLYVTELELDGCNLSDISFMNEMNGLTHIFLDNNNISDLLPLSGKMGAKNISLNNNKVVDITPLEDLSSLRALMLGNNQISDISPINKMKELQVLNLNGNQITDPSPVSSLSKPWAIFMDGNPLETIKPFSKLTSLYWLSLCNIQLDDVKPLAKLNDLYRLDLSDNLIEDPTPLAKLKNILDLSLYDNPIKNPDTALEKMPFLNLGTNEEYLLLDQPFVFEDAKVQSAFQASVDYSSGTMAGQIENRFMRRTGLGEISNQATYRDARDLYKLDLSFLDLKELPDLSHFKRLGNLVLVGNPEVDFSPVENMQLAWLSIEIEKKSSLIPLYTQTDLSEISIVAEKDYVFSQADYDWIISNKQLEYFSIDYSGEFDISFVPALKKLRYLTLTDATINDFTPLAKASASSVQLNSFELNEDFWSIIATNKKLTSLSIHDSSLGDVSDITKLTKLDSLMLGNCGITDDDLILLQKLTKLVYLNLPNNNISDVSALQKLSKVAWLRLQNNQIVDVEPLTKMKGLKRLNLTNNPVANDWDALVELFPKVNMENSATSMR